MTRALIYRLNLRLVVIELIFSYSGGAALCVWTELKKSKYAKFVDANLVFRLTSDIHSVDQKPDELTSFQSS